MKGIVLEWYRDYMFKIRDIYRKEGMLFLAANGARKVAHMSFHTNRAFWFERDLGEPILRFMPRIPLGIDFCTNLESHEVLRDLVYPKRPPGSNQLKEMETARENGHVFPFITHRDEIIGFMKVGYDQIYIKDFEQVLDFPRGVSFVYDTFVKADCRGLGAAGFMITGCMGYLRKEGYGKLRCHIPPWNVASIKAYSRCGFRRQKYVRYVRILGGRFYTNDPMSN